MCLVGLGGKVTILGADDEPGAPLWIHVELDDARPSCEGCGGRVVIGDRRRVELVDLACFGRPTRLVWHKRLWRCADRCGASGFVDANDDIAAQRHLLTTRAGKWATCQVGGDERPVARVAAELGVDWHTVNDAVCGWGAALLEADVDRIGTVTAVGVDETLFVKRGRYRTKQWATSITDAETGQLLDMVPGRDAAAPTAWFATRPAEWLAQIRFAVLDMSAAYKLCYDTILSHATQVIDPFHVVKTAISKIDQCRRRVQQVQTGHRGHKNDPLYRSRRLLTMGAERLDPERHHRIHDLLSEGDPDGEVRRTWWAVTKLRELYQRPDRGVAAAMLWLYADAFRDARNPIELRQLGRTLNKWLSPIMAWFLHAQISNARAEAVNNLTKKIKRVGHGFTNFDNYRIRCLLANGKINWNLLNTLNPPEIR